MTRWHDRLSAFTLWQRLLTVGAVTTLCCAGAIALDYLWVLHTWRDALEQGLVLWPVLLAGNVFQLLSVRRRRARDARADAPPLDA